MHKIQVSSAPTSKLNAMHFNCCPCSFPLITCCLPGIFYSDFLRRIQGIVGGTTPELMSTKRRSQLYYVGLAFFPSSTIGSHDEDGDHPHDKQSFCNRNPRLASSQLKEARRGLRVQNDRFSWGWLRSHSSSWLPIGDKSKKKRSTAVVRRENVLECYCTGYRQCEENRQYMGALSSILII